MTVTPLGRDQDCSLKNREPDVPPSLGSWILEVGARPPRLACTSSSLESVPCPSTPRYQVMLTSLIYLELSLVKGKSNTNGLLGFCIVWKLLQTQTNSCDLDIGFKKGIFLVIHRLDHMGDSYHKGLDVGPAKELMYWFGLQMPRLQGECRDSGTLGRSCKDIHNYYEFVSATVIVHPEDTVFVYNLSPMDFHPTLPRWFLSLME
ncbi:hypothetical protein STEG23_028361 [Scotinomys teguina]